MLKGSLPGNSWSYICRPIVEAGQALLVDDTFQLDETFTLVPTPGHSPCHCCVMIRSQGQQAIVTGDMMHHALQCREPDWSTIFDAAPVQAAQSRRRLLGSGRRHRHICPADPFPQPDHRPRRRRMATASAIRSCGRRTHRRCRAGSLTRPAGSSTPPHNPRRDSFSQNDPNSPEFGAPEFGANSANSVTPA